MARGALPPVRTNTEDTHEHSNLFAWELQKVGIMFKKGDFIKLSKNGQLCRVLDDQTDDYVRAFNYNVNYATNIAASNYILADPLDETTRKNVEYVRSLLTNTEWSTAAKECFRTLLTVIDAHAPKPREETCDGKIVEIDGKKYQLKLVQ